MWGEGPRNFFEPSAVKLILTILAMFVSLLESGEKIYTVSHGALFYVE